MSASSVTRPDAAPFGLDPLPVGPTDAADDALSGMEDAFGAEGTTRIVVLGGHDGVPRALDAGAVRPRRGTPVHPLSPVSLLEVEASGVVTGRRPVPRPPRIVPPPGAGTVPGSVTIAMPRPAALAVAALMGGAATISLMLLGRPELEFVSPVQVALPLVLVVAVTGVGRLFDWVPLAWTEWRGPLGFASAAPWAGLMLLASAAPALALPTWLAPASGVGVAAPFLWSAFGPGRLRARLRPNPDAHGRRGGLLAAGVLGMVAYSGQRPDLGGLLPAVLFLALVVSAFATRGLADAGATWRVGAWAALVWGSIVVWASTLLAAVSMPLPWWMQLLGVGLASGPLALATRGAGRGRS